MLPRLRNPLALGAVVMLGLLAGLQYWLAARRPISPWYQAGREFTVTSEADQGPGSLREAIFAADSSDQRAKIVLRTSRIVLQSPLPPLVNPKGVIVEAGEARPEIDASNIGFGPVFDVDAPNSVISGIAIRNAPEQAILVRADGFRLMKASLAGCDVGLYAADGISNLVAENSTFENNRIGIWLAASNAGVIVRDNQFKAHRDAGVWAVAGKQPAASTETRLELRGNHFEGDRLSIVLGNIPAVIEANEVVKAREAAIYLIGAGAVVRGNRVRNGAGIGIFAHTTEGTVIENNELDHNQALAMLVRSAQNNLVDRNRIYNNGYGIGFVLGQRGRPNIASDNTLLSQQFDGIILIGESPVLRGNRLVNNKLAGLRVLDFFPLIGNKVVADPFLADNILAGNKLNEPIRGEYRVQKSEKPQ